MDYEKLYNECTDKIELTFENRIQFKKILEDHGIMPDDIDKNLSKFFRKRKTISASEFFFHTRYIFAKLDGNSILFSDLDGDCEVNYYNGKTYGWNEQDQLLKVFPHLFSEDLYAIYVYRDLGKGCGNGGYVDLVRARTKTEAINISTGGKADLKWHGAEKTTPETARSIIITYERESKYYKDTAERFAKTLGIENEKLEQNII